VAKHLAELPKGGSFGLEDAGFFRLSLAGSQEKTALLWHEGQWCRPEGSTPSTHILKLPMGRVPGGIDLSTSVENEFVCMQVLRAFGMPTARVAVLRFHGRQVLAVERFDRRFSEESGWLRLPQEDFAQVFGVDPARKYEDHGGPGIRAILDQLIGSSNAEADRVDFMRAQVLFWMLAAIDGHAKNFSVFLEPRGAFRLTPRYDVISAYPVMGSTAGKLSPFKVRMSMAVWRTDRHYLWTQIRRAHFEYTARACKIEGFGAVIDELIKETPRVLSEVRPQVSRLPTRVSEPILEGVRLAAERLANG
jgi:serine/threonine-protein kinase HipA